MDCYLTEYRARVGSWAARIVDGSITWKRTLKVQGKCKRQVVTGIGMLILSVATLVVLLVIGGVETNPGPGVESEKIMRVLCSGCDKILKSGTQYDTCGCWFHNSCGIVKTRAADCGKLVCDTCRSERLRILEQKLQDALKQIETVSR
jgi:hypothetical protein